SLSSTDLVVGCGQYGSVRFLNCFQGLPPTSWSTDPDRARPRFRMLPWNNPILPLSISCGKRGSSCSLYANHPGSAIYQIKIFQFPKSLPNRTYVACVSDRNKNGVRDPLLELLPHFEGDSLLSFNPVRIQRIDQVKIVTPFSHLACFF